MAKENKEVTVEKVPEVTPDVTPEAEVPEVPEENTTVELELGESLDTEIPAVQVTAVVDGVEYAVVKPFMSTDKLTHGKRVNFGFTFKSGSVFSDKYVALLVNVGHIVENTKEVQAMISATKASVQSQQLVEGTMVVGDVDSIIGVVSSSEANLEQA